jgi:hypothetical protein
MGLFFLISYIIAQFTVMEHLNVSYYTSAESTPLIYVTCKALEIICNSG